MDTGTSFNLLKDRSNVVRELRAPSAAGMVSN